MLLRTQPPSHANRTLFEFRPMPSSTPQPQPSPSVTVPFVRLGTSDGRRTEPPCTQTVAAPAATTSDHLAGGSLGMLRQRDTGNSPTKQRLALPLSSSVSDFSSTGAFMGPSRASLGLRQRPPPTAVSLDTGLHGGLGSLTNTYLIPPLADGAAANESKRRTVTVVFDLDETLCSNRRPGKALLRPHALDLLRHLRQLSNDPTVGCNVEIILWTASMECVARPVVERLDPKGEIFQHLIFRDRRWYKETGYTKDLKRLGRDMSHTVIIENSPQSVRLNRRNAILVRDYLGGQPNDNDLAVVREVLDQWIRHVGAAAATQPSSDLISDAPINTSIVTFLSQHKQIGMSNEVVSSFKPHTTSMSLRSTSSPISPYQRLTGLNTTLPLLSPLRRK